MTEQTNVMEELKRMNRETIMFIKGNPTAIFLRQFNAEKQAFIELAFSNEMVENPEDRKVKLGGYIR